MSHWERIAGAFRSLSPSLFIAAVTVAAIQSLFAVGGDLVRSQMGTELDLALGPVVAVTATVLLLPLYVGLYAIVREESSVRSAIAVVRENYRKVFVADAFAVGFAIVTALAGAVIVLGAHTAVRYSEYAGGRVTPPFHLDAFGLLVLGATAGYWLGFLLTRFADVLVAFDERSPRTAWVGSLRYVRRRPLSFAGYALLVTLLLGLPKLVNVVLAESRVVGSLSSRLAIGMLVGGVGLALVAALHVSYFEGSVRPALGTDPVTISRRRLALVGIVLLSATAGTAVVRTADLAVDDGTPQPLPATASDGADVAIENTFSSNYRWVITYRNASAGETLRRSESVAVDYREREMRIKFFGDEGIRFMGGYFGEGIIAAQPTMNETAVRPEVLNERSLPGFSLVGRDAQETRLDDVDWRFVNETDDTYTYRIDDSDAILSSFRGGRRGTRGGLASDSRATLVVNRSSGYVDHVTYHLRSRETGNAYTYVDRFVDVGGDPVDRPATLGSPRWYEWLYDALYY